MFVELHVGRIDPRRRCRRPIEESTRHVQPQRRTNSRPTCSWSSYRYRLRLRIRSWCVHREYVLEVVSCRSVVGRIGSGRQLRFHPAAHWIVATRKVPRVVSVQALHPGACAGNASRWPWARLLHVDEGISQFGIPPVCIFDVMTWNFTFRSPHTTLGLESAHESIHVGIAQPEQRWHRRAIIEKRGIAKNDRTPIGVAHDNDECAARFTAEKLGDDLAIRFQ